MDNKINYRYIETYSEAFGDKVLYSEGPKDKFSGEDILQLTPLKQINLLVLKILFQYWKAELAKLKSPYFDYEGEEVKKALNNLMNTLSRNILVNHHDLEPLLKKAVHQSILLIFSPYDYYLHELRDSGKAKTSLNDLKDIQKYIKVNRRLLEIFIEELENRKLDTLTIDEAVGVLNQVLEKTKEEPDDFMPKKAELDQIVPFDLDQMYNIQGRKVTELPESPSVDQSPAGESSYRPTLNDRFQKGDKMTLADLHARQKITDIKKHISINQRFMFVNDLFGGDTNEFNLAIESLEKLENFGQAQEFLSHNYQEKHHWDMESEEVNEFIEILQKRYM